MFNPFFNKKLFQDYVFIETYTQAISDFQIHEISYVSAFLIEHKIFDFPYFITKNMKENFKNRNRIPSFKYDLPIIKQKIINHNRIELPSFVNKYEMHPMNLDGFIIDKGKKEYKPTKEEFYEIQNQLKIISKFQNLELKNRDYLISKLALESGFLFPILENYFKDKSDKSYSDEENAYSFYFYNNFMFTFLDMTQNIENTIELFELFTRLLKTKGSVIEYLNLNGIRIADRYIQYKIIDDTDKEILKSTYNVMHNTSF
jgi:hypothetical protein